MVCFETIYSVHSAQYFFMKPTSSTS